jgi:allophanate hydrolase
MNQLLHPLQSLSFEFPALHAAYAGGLSPEEVVDEVYRRLEASAGEHIWTHIVPREQARAAARGLHDSTLPLYGMPFGVKDNIDVAGLPTTAACSDFSYIATRTAAVVERLLAAGAILIGKQNMDQFATGLVGIRSPHGYCRNPFDRRYIPGGSSSGSAVAVSTGQVAFSIGSDTGGSGRVPAALNNIVGLKPTPGLVSSYGFVYCNRSFDVPPVFALTVDDAYQVLDAIEGVDERDPFSVVAPPREARTRDLPATFRFGVPAAPDLTFFGDEQAQAQFALAIAHLHALGGEEVAIDFAPFLGAGKLVFNSAFIAERSIAYGVVAERGGPNVHPTVQSAILAGQQYSAADAFTAVYALEEFKRQVNLQLDRVDLLVVPTAGTIYRCDQVEADPVALNANMGYYTYFANPLRLSAVSTPVGLRADGLPFGVCLLAQSFQENRLYAYASALQSALGESLGATGHPPFSH